MKLLYAQASPFVRKVMACAIELGLADRIELLACAAHPVDRDPQVVARNPLGKIPTLTTDDGLVLYDSRVICEYLDRLDGRHRLFPGEGAARWRALREQALADGRLDAAVLLRYEQVVREEAARSPRWIAGQRAKVESALAEIERAAADFGDRVDIGTIATACALGYLDFRFADLRWRDAHPSAARWFAAFLQRESMRRTQPPAA